MSHFAHSPDPFRRADPFRFDGRVRAPRAVCRAAHLAGVCLALGIALGPAAAGAHAQASGESGPMFAGADVPRELTAADAAGMEPPRIPDPPTSLARVEVLDDEGVVDVVIGPVRMDADAEHLRVPIQTVRFPVDGWIHGFEAVMRTGLGEPLPDAMLHHVNVIDPDHVGVFAPIARRVMAAGRETHAEKLPGFLGYPINAGQRLIVATMLSNVLGRPVTDAYLHVRLFVSTEEDAILLQPRNVFPFYLDVMGPVGVKDFPVPPGHSVRSWEASPAIDGRILGLSGHVHDHATSLRLEDATTGEVLWEAEPKVNEDGRVVGVPTSKPWWRGGIKVEREHVYRIVVEYDNPTGRPAPLGGMGAIGGVMWVPGGEEWPEIDRDDPEYVADMWNTMTAPARMAAGMDHGIHGGGGGAAGGHGMHGADGHVHDAGHAHDAAHHDAADGQARGSAGHAHGSAGPTTGAGHTHEGS